MTQKAIKKNALFVKFNTFHHRPISSQITEERLLKKETALFKLDFLGNFSLLFSLKVEALLRKSGLL